jgi:acyl-coenzyme A synthetase/AMP-(fatty) acid ligase
LYFSSFIYKTSASEKCAVIVCTSGSSGNAKLACVSHEQQIQIFTWVNDYNQNNISLNMTSPYWLNGINNMIFNALHGQKRLITSKPFTADLCFDLIEKYNITTIFLSPPFIALLVESPRFKNFDFGGIQRFITGGICVSENLRRTIQDRLTNGYMINGYGMTEFGGVIAKTTSESSLSSSVGIPTINTEIRILLDDGTTGGVKEIGEILVRNPVKFLGYYQNRHKTIVDDEGWLHTGDMGFVDENFEINIIGQRTFAIKNFYNEIFPSEIEDIILTVEGVKQVVVVGTPDPIDLEIPAALIVRDPMHNVNEDLINEAINDLPPYKQLRGGVYFVESLPTTNTGKIQRKLAKEIAIKLRIERGDMRV